MSITINNKYDEATYALSPSNPSLWNKIPHKGMKALSEEEIKNEMKELAVKAKNTNEQTELKKIDMRKTELCAQYMSYVSPDRKALFEEAKKAVNGQRKQHNANKPLGELSLVYYLTEKDHNKSTKGATMYPLSNGAFATSFLTNGGGNGFNVNVTGEEVLSYSYGRLSYTPTSAEHARAQELYQIFDNTYRNAGLTQTKVQTNVSTSSTYYYHDNMLFVKEGYSNSFDNKI